MKRNKYWLSLLITITLLLSCTSCGFQKQEVVTLHIGASEQEQDIVTKAVEEFKNIHKEEADFDISVQVTDIQDIKQTVLSGLEGAVDIYPLASDQLAYLESKNCLLPITEDTQQLMDDCGGKDAMVIRAATDDNQLYAYPFSAGNGYFMYYNKKYFNDNDIQSLDKMLDIASKEGKFVAMDWSSGWYLYSFFAGAGLSVVATDDGLHNTCNFNSTTGKYTGLDVAKALINIANNRGFKNVISDNVLKDIKDGKVIAAVNGAWNAKVIEECWGNDIGACKLPTYTLDGDQVQMASFTGYKYLGIKPNTKHKSWAMKLARYLTNEKFQMMRFEKIGEVPVNIKAASSEKVKSSLALSALQEQNQYASVQNVNDNYWDPMTVLGTYLASGNPDHKDLQKILDDTVNKITK